MTNERIQVTVDGPSVMAEISLAQVEEYLRQRGWELSEAQSKNWIVWVRLSDREAVRFPRDLTRRDSAWCFARAIGNVGRLEGRAAYEVLRDMAVEVLPAPGQCEAGGFGARERGKSVVTAADEGKSIGPCPRRSEGCAGELVAIISDDGSAFEAEGCTTCLCTWWNSQPKLPPEGVESMSYSAFDAKRRGREMTRSCASSVCLVDRPTMGCEGVVMSNESKPLDLDALEAKARADLEMAAVATRGPWRYKSGVLKHYVFSEDDGEECGVSLQELHWKDGRLVPAAANAQFIAASRTGWEDSAKAVLDLAAELREARDALAMAEHGRNMLRLALDERDAALEQALEKLEELRSTLARGLSLARAAEAAAKGEES